MSTHRTPTKVTIAGRDITVERVSARKASRALALMRALSKAMPGLQTELAQFRRTYEAENVVALDRVQARIRHPARPMTDGEGELITTPPVYNDAGELVDPGGQPVMLPSPVDKLTEADWAQSDHKYIVPVSPTQYEIVAALFDHAVEVAEEHVYALLALFTIPNDEITRRRKDGSLPERIQEVADELVDDAMADELLELAVVIGETVDDQFRSKTRELGDRLGKAASLIGIDWTPKTAKDSPAAATSSDGPSPTNASSFIDSDASTDGPATPSSIAPSTSSSSSVPSTTATANDKSSPTPVAAP